MADLIFVAVPCRWTQESLLQRAQQKSRADKPWNSDQEIVAQILSGSRAHFDLLYETYFDRVYRFAMKYLRDAEEAQDVAQEVFTTVFRVLHSFKGESSLLVWIFGITRNTVNRCFRKARPHFQSFDAEGTPEVAEEAVPIDNAIEARRLLSRCAEVIAKDLTPLQRRIFHLRHLRRQSVKIIATTLGKSEDAIKANLYRMRQVLLANTPGLDTLFSK